MSSGFGDRGYGLRGEDSLLVEQGKPSDQEHHCNRGHSGRCCREGQEPGYSACDVRGSWEYWRVKIASASGTAPSASYPALLRRTRYSKKDFIYFFFFLIFFFLRVAPSTVRFSDSVLHVRNYRSTEGRDAVPCEHSRRRVRCLLPTRSQPPVFDGRDDLILAARPHVGAFLPGYFALPSSSFVQHDSTEFPPSLPSSSSLFTHLLLVLAQAWTVDQKIEYLYLISCGLVGKFWCVWTMVSILTSFFFPNNSCVCPFDVNDSPAFILQKLIVSVPVTNWKIQHLLAVQLLHIIILLLNHNDNE